ncbi:ABC transporter substrate-binding protein [uncultured Pseudokineococcus sp.]|uniref:ABC transporter substrate-binding protein n=1 Tax=uncultured Pseudokineococcus sp. TaxID=1642928 RepID=UPI00262FEA8D|nr:extracellular solute-binding protein [uncultured Pseudokineococcus sp.]
MRRSRTALSLVSGLVAASVLSGCSGSDDGASGGGDPDAPAQLDFWTWAPNIQGVVDIWNEQNPDQQVTVDSQAQGDEAITRLLTASQAGEAPCLMQAEYQALPVLVANGVASDLTDDVEDVRDAFPEGAWDLTSFGDQAYAMPQDVGPMMLYYREDLFEELGLEVPTTWEEFRATAQQVREADPERYLTTFSAGDPGWFAGLSQAAGADWWATDGEAWEVSITDDATTQVADYWGDLVTEDLVDDQPMYTPEWNAAMNDGTLLAWPSAVWGAGVLEGVAPDTAGSWRAVPMPQWGDGEQVTGFWGGSATAISEDCEDRAQALEFATWLNTAPEAVEALVSVSGIYPAATEGQTGPALEEPPSMLPNQPDFYEQAAQITETARGFTWGPNVNVTYQSYVDQFQSAVSDRTSFTAALEGMQETSVADLEQQGFEVAEGS